MCVFVFTWCCRYVFGVVFNGLTLTLGTEARGLTVHCGLLYGHNIYSLGLVLVTGGSQTLLHITVHMHHSFPCFLDARIDVRLTPSIPYGPFVATAVTDIDRIQPYPSP